MAISQRLTVARHRQLHFGTFTRSGADLGLAAVPAHAPDDRAADAVPIVFHSRQVETGSAVSNVDTQLVLFGLSVERYAADLGVPGRVHQSLPGGGDHRVDLVVVCGVTDDDRVDRDGVRVLDLGRDLLQRGREALNR